MMDRDTKVLGGALALLLTVWLGYAAVIVGVAYVVSHFLRKYW